MTPKSRIFSLGVSHHTAPLALRDRLHCAASEFDSTLSACSAVGGIVVLATCHRIELYADVAVAPEAAAPLLHHLLSQVTGVPENDYRGHAYHHAGNAVAVHLMRVACGLDSRILGEPQILGQVAEAHRLASDARHTTPALDALFRAAIRTGKRARAETAIGQKPATIPAIAVAQALNPCPDPTRSSFLIVGAGEMARLTLKALRRRGMTEISVANRTLARAQAMVVPWQGQAFGLDRLKEALASADVVFVAASTRTPLVNEAIVGHRDRPLVLVDLAVPRGVSAEVRLNSAVRLIDVDALQATLDRSLAARRAEVPHVEAIITAENTRLEAVLRRLAIRPVIVDLRLKAEAIRRQELDRTLRYLDDLDPQARQHLRRFSHALVNKLLHEPTTRLRQRANDDDPDALAATIRELFGLDNQA